MEGDGSNSGRVAPELAEDSDYHSDIDTDFEHYDHDDDEMLLSEDEHEWALRIKEIIQDDPELREATPLSDMMIAQIALVTMAEEELGLHDDNDNDIAANANETTDSLIDRVKERVRGIQQIHHDYEIVESLDSAKALMTRWVTDLFPGFLLGFEERGGSYANLKDMTNLDATVLSDDDKHKLAIKGMYYLYHCQNLHLAATRNGMISMNECQGYYWKSKTMVSLLAMRAWSPLASGYPLHYKSIVYFNSGMFINLVTSMVKRFIPPGMAKKFQFDAKSNYRLDQIYLQPSLADANQRILKDLHKALETRFHNEATFSLIPEEEEEEA